MPNITKSSVLTTFRTKLAENHDAKLAAMQTACIYTMDVRKVVSVIREAVADRRKPIKEFKMNTPKSAKGMFKGDSSSDLEGRRSRDKASIAAADKQGRGHAAATKDVRRVDFALRAKKKGGDKWHKPVDECDDDIGNH